MLDKCIIKQLILCTFGIPPLLNTEALQLQKPIFSLSDENISSAYFLFADEHIALFTPPQKYVCMWGVLNNTKDVRLGKKSLSENMHKSAQLARNI